MTHSYSETKTQKDLQLWKCRKPMLTWLDIELTERCNFNCVHCYINLPPEDISASEKELDTDSLKKILSQAASLGCLTVRFTGGEPLLREDFEEIYLFTRKLGIKVVLFTNASLISSGIAGLLSRTPPLMPIEISVYGMKKSTCEAVTRTKGSFESVNKGIRFLDQLKIPYVVKTTVLPQNRMDTVDFLKWAGKNPWMERIPQVNTLLNLRCRRDSENKNGTIRKLRGTPEEVVGEMIRIHKDYKTEMKRFFKSFSGISGPRLFTCSGDRSVCVDAYGHFQMCLLLRHSSVIASYKSISLKSALTDYFPGIVKMKATNPQYLKKCANCFLKSLCDQCPAKSDMEFGTLDTPIPYFCEISHHQAIYLGLLEKGEKAWEIINWEERVQAFLSNDE